jgi:6-phosphogluconolactonase (cycloisomerase 2 family)
VTTGSPFYFAYVGSRTTRERNARGDGINVYRVDAISGDWTHVQLVESLLNPSFLALDRSGRFLYCVHGDASEISAFSIDPETGRLTFIHQETTEGKNPVHLSVDPGNRFLIVANHVTRAWRCCHGTRTARSGSLWIWSSSRDRLVRIGSSSPSPSPIR